MMTRQERIDNYTFIYVDPDPNEAPPSKKPNVRPEKRNRRSSGSVRKKEDGPVKSPDREQPPRRQLPRRQCSVSNTDDSTNSQASNEEKNQRGDQHKASSPKQNAGCDAQEQQDSPPPVRAWKTAAARKLLPLSITMKRLNVEITKCDWPLLQKKAAQSPKRDQEEDKEERVEREARQPDLGYCSPEVGVTQKQERACMTELSGSDISYAGAFHRIAELNPSPVLRRTMTGTKERKTGRRGEAPRPAGGAKRGECSRHPLQDHTTAVHTVCSRQTCRGCSCPDECWTCTVSQGCSSFFFWSEFSGSQERKLQRRSVRSRSESERGGDPVPKKKTKKEQVPAA